MRKMYVHAECPAWDSENPVASEVVVRSTRTVVHELGGFDRNDEPMTDGDELDWESDSVLHCQGCDTSVLRAAVRLVGVLMLALVVACGGEEATDAPLLASRDGGGSGCTLDWAGGSPIFRCDGGASLDAGLLDPGDAGPNPSDQGVTDQSVVAADAFAAADDAFVAELDATASEPDAYVEASLVEAWTGPSDCDLPGASSCSSGRCGFRLDASGEVDPFSGTCAARACTSVSCGGTGDACVIGAGTCLGAARTCYDGACTEYCQLGDDARCRLVIGVGATCKDVGHLERGVCAR